MQWAEDGPTAQQRQPLIVTHFIPAVAFPLAMVR
jgi:hypothetical protein